MGRNSSGNRGTKDGGGDYKGKITNVGPLVEMTDPQCIRQPSKPFRAIMPFWV